jgi:hypothetical protein
MISMTRTSSSDCCCCCCCCRCCCERLQVVVDGPARGRGRGGTKCRSGCHLSFSHGDEFVTMSLSPGSGEWERQDGVRGAHHQQRGLGGRVVDKQTARGSSTCGKIKTGLLLNRASTSQSRMHAMLPLASGAPWLSKSRHPEQSRRAQ